MKAITAAALVVGCGTPARTDQGPSPTGVTRYFIGGDSRDDTAHVVRWAFGEAKARGVSAFVFLGDMELTPRLDSRFATELAQLDPIPFYPVLGNHEVKQFGRFSIGEARWERRFRARFLEDARTPVGSSLAERVVYSVDLAGGVHLIALDNVSQRGFGAEQLQWLRDDLDRASANAATRYIIVGMHQPLAHNGVTTHGMDADGPQAVKDSDEALALFVQHHVAIIFASHDHRFARFDQAGIRTFITGGLGAPLDHAVPADSFHHVLELDVTATGIDVEVVRFPGAPRTDEMREDD